MMEVAVVIFANHLHLVPVITIPVFNTLWARWPFCHTTTVSKH